MHINIKRQIEDIDEEQEIYKEETDKHKEI